MLNSKALVTGVGAQLSCERMSDADKTGSNKSQARQSGRVATEELAEFSVTVSTMSRTKNWDYESESEWNPATFDRVVAQYQPRIYRFIYAMVGEAETAHDLTQDTFLSAYKSLLKRAEAAQKAEETGLLEELERYNPANNNISAWLYTIARNTALSEMRRHKVVRFFSFWQRTGSNEGEEEIDGMADVAALEPGGSIETHFALRDELQRAMDKVGRERLTALLLHMDGFSYKEICLITGDSLSSIKSQIFRAKESLRRVLSTKAVTGSSAGLAEEAD
jgi:RNA polymerase sigma-70 factor (ECF subfamily)